jgi:hypothetical protein
MEPPDRRFRGIRIGRFRLAAAALPLPLVAGAPRLCAAPVEIPKIPGGIMKIGKGSSRRETGHVNGRAMVAVLFVAAAAGAVACDDPITTDRTMSPGMSAVVDATNTEGRFVSNRVRYRDTGMKPAVGRAGSATLSALVLADGNGRAVLHIAAGSTTGDRARLGQVQIKVFDTDGNLLFTRNEVPGPDAPTAEYLLRGVDREGRVQIKANIRGADPARVGVVTVDAPFARQPDLQVGEIAAPARAGVRSSVGIAATIRELNGEMGARADCVLLVDDVEVDRAWWIWVDAGSSVTCAFRHRFMRVGVAEVEVRLVDVDPVDADPANNSARTTVEIQLIPSAFVYDASVEDITFESSWRSEYSYESAEGRSGYESRDHYEHRRRDQHAMLWAWTPRALTFPLAELDMRQLTRDETIHSARFLDVEPDWSYSGEWGSEACLGRWFDRPNGSLNFNLCTMQWGEHDPSTYVYYSRYAGEVTYHSHGESRWWDLDGGFDDTWSSNYSGDFSTGRMVSYGTEYEFFIRAEDVNGIYRMQPLVWLEPFSDTHHIPWSCWEYSDEWGSDRGCHEHTWAATGVRGWVDGWPTY